MFCTCILFIKILESNHAIGNALYHFSQFFEKAQCSLFLWKKQPKVVGVTAIQSFDYPRETMIVLMLFSLGELCQRAPKSKKYHTINFKRNHLYQVEMFQKGKIGGTRGVRVFIFIFRPMPICAEAQKAKKALIRVRNRRDFETVHSRLKIHMGSKIDLGREFVQFWGRISPIFGGESV